LALLPLFLFNRMPPLKDVSQLNAEIDTAVNVAGPTARKTTASGLNGLLKSLAAELTARAPAALPLATPTTPGAVKVGPNLTVGPDGTVAAAAQVQNSLTPASATIAPSAGAVTAALANLESAIGTERKRLDALVTGAPAALDTLAEISRQLVADEQGAAALLAAQHQHTQQLASLKPLVAGANITLDASSVPGSIVLSGGASSAALSAVARRYHNGAWLASATYYEAIASVGDAELAVFNSPSAAALTTATRCYGSVDAAGFACVVHAELRVGCYKGYVRNADFSGRGSLVATSAGASGGCEYVLAHVRSSLPLTVSAGAVLSLDGYVATAPHTITYAGTLVVHATCDLHGVTLVKSGNGVLDDRRPAPTAPGLPRCPCRRRRSSHCCRPCRRGKTIIRLLVPARRTAE
jgi:hypothetical protein